MAYRRVAAIKTVDDFRQYLSGLGLSQPVDDRVLSAADGSPLAQPIDVGGFTVGNRWCIQPMEGWDGTTDGHPTEHTIRRWEHFGASGAKLIWGGEAVAVVPEGRANPNQLISSPETEAGLKKLLDTLMSTHEASFGTGSTKDLLVGLQLTHSGRFCRPKDKKKLEPRIAYHHPVLDPKFGIDPKDDKVVLTDSEIEQLHDAYVVAAKRAQKLGFQFVDLKCCHGYLGHEFLSAYDRPGQFGGDFEGRTRYIRDLVAKVSEACPGLMIGVRLSVFDQPPYRPSSFDKESGTYGPGIPHEVPAGYRSFGAKADDPFAMDLSEPIELLNRLWKTGKVQMINLTAASPYYNPHLQRPAYFPPSDGYQPPEDPLVGCVRQIDAVAEVKKAVPHIPIVGSAYTYFQEYLPHVAQANVRDGKVDFIGLGRMVLSYWNMPADTLKGIDTRSQKMICRTFSDCTTAPRNGIISGCFPLDPYYKQMPENQQVKDLKAQLKAAAT
ncbi:beta/alpha barrel domain-containing protein [Lacunimicrobium album]